MRHAAAYNVWTKTREDIRAVALGVLEGAAWTASYRGGSTGPKAVDNQHAAVAGVLREVFGNPFRQPRLARKCLTADVLVVARTIYEEGTFNRLPILTDALMDAGCSDDVILGHLRSPGPHIRGCWVLDLLLEMG